MVPSIAQAALSLFLVGSSCASGIVQRHAILNKRAVAPPAVLPGTWTYQGCYTDPGPRTLAGASYTSAAAMTDESCISYCANLGYIFAGTEYGSECYCGNVLASTGAVAPSTDCSTACSGNSTQACGAGNRLTVFWNGKTPPPGPKTNPGVANYGYFGCYTEGTSGRALSVGIAVPGGGANMTVANCVSACAAASTTYVYAGVEYASECYCGVSIATSATVAPGGISDCSMTCNGNSSEFCGAGNRLNIYKKGYSGSSSTISSVIISSTTSRASTSSSSAGVTTRPSTQISTSTTSTARASSTSSTTPSSAATGLPTGWKYAGCYTEGTGGRALSYQQAGGNTNTVESCVSACVGLGYTIAGLEYSSQCFCDNALHNGATSAPETRCNMACAGNSKENCGAGDILSIYNTGTLTVFQPPASQADNLPGNWVYQGCYSDNVNQKRALFWQSNLTKNNTATTCLNLCAQYGYSAAGTEYGLQCFCGDDSALVASGSTKQAESDCSVVCSGDPNHNCGAGNRLSYYKWVGAPALNVWNTPAAGTPAYGQYKFLIGGVVVPLITTTGVNGKVTFLEKSGTGAPNTTGAYELDLAQLDNFSKAWRPMHVKSDIFCSASITLPDKVGRQLNIGGWAGASTFGVRIYWPDGSPGVWGVNDWQENNNELSLLEGRWYPSAMIMTNGSVLVMGGEIGSNSAPSPSCEILPRPAGGYSKYLDWLDRTDPNNLYPFMYVLPQGNILVIYYNEARIISEVTFDTVRTLPNLPGSVQNFLAGRTYPLEGTSVLLPQYAPYTDPLTVLVCGGSANGNSLAIDNCVSTQPEVPGANWTIERMPSQRVLSCMAALPDGTYLIVNGARQGVAGFGLAQDPNLGAVLYDPSKPVNQRFTIMANTIIARLYHSEAMLLQDGRVLISGSDPQSDIYPEEYRVEVFLPSYLLNGATKPTFTLTNKDWAYGSSIQLTNVVRPAGGAARVSMLAAVSSTHGNSMGQRTLFPAVSCAGATCTVTAPPNAHVCPPGWYQIFLLDGPTPSNSIWVRLGGSIADAANLGNWPAYNDFLKPGLGAVGS
ncbi:WSC domain-containing protein [Phlyctema vagabunda]|uniref:WSC domain-containing protein n=1 Tax=Phlyctema vagabunda TaxID=108571 RepID=A0ABR4PEI1_9HELO